MGRPPAYIFVVRHGHRLDATDKQWHLSSPAPYDPPLTYNGWLQTQALGARISSILKERIRDDEVAAAQHQDSSTRPKRRKYKIIVHSSPFLRCVQTSIGLSAGIAKDPTPLLTSAPSGRIPPINTLSLGSPKKLDAQGPTSPNRIAKPVQLHETRKTILRLDAFLGEWLTPGYFELITPPPESVMMLATAKADLLRPENYQTSFPAYATHVHSSSQGQLWGGSPRSSPVTSSPTQPDGLDNFSNPSGTLTRSSSLSSHHGTPSGPPSAHTGGYVAPVPHYAINSNNTIPLGYVAHARDACVKVDYQWDSMRGPLEWGDGGKFGEEWTEMHRRFRNGLQHLVDWYASAENPTEMVTRTARWAAKKTPDDPDCAVEDEPEEDDDNDDTEAVVVLVSHGAGCNALIGALTHQPVLMDVSMASLTMAVRKSDEELHMLDHLSMQHGKIKGGKIPLHEYYDLKILASTEHLRSNSQGSGLGLNRTPSTTAGTRGRFAGAFASSLSNASYNDVNGSRATSANAALTNSRRPSGTSSATEQRGGVWAGPRSGITVGSGMTSFSTRNPSSGLARTPSIGLWSPVPKDEEEEDDDSMVLNFSNFSDERVSPTEPAQSQDPAVNITAPSEPSPPTPSAEDAKENGRSSGGLAKSQSEAFLSRKGDETPKPGQPGLAVSSLWGGGPRPPGEAERIRDLSSTKRRWTVNQMET
ncbi:hypothetical protein BR93DRAFT_346860 [Coniochaeta sp. PMI_546]|nr:hypothetical protein BR93DRAFT_346860 [Coniochaeta sp. PMI_546]